MKARKRLALFSVAGVAVVLIAVLAASQRLPARDAALPLATKVPVPTPTPLVPAWEWMKPGFAGPDAITLTHGITQYLRYAWSPQCDAPERRHIPMIWGKAVFNNRGEMTRLFDGPCNDGRPLLFLNEPAKEEQANVPPIEAAAMFYTMTRGTDWPHERWRGPIYAGGNLVEERSWDAEFVRQFARLYNDGRLAIPEIAGWAIHLYGNYEYGPDAGSPTVMWTADIPQAEIAGVVDRSMAQVDEYLAARRAEGNATSLVVTEFGLLQASQWHTPRTYYYTTTAAFMDAYVRRFDLRPEIQAWFWYKSVGSADTYLDADPMVDVAGQLTPNGVQWRELAAARQGGVVP